jgi:hypothetical protein
MDDLEVATDVATGGLAAQTAPQRPGCRFSHCDSERMVCEDARSSCQAVVWRARAETLARRPERASAEGRLRRSLVAQMRSPKRRRPPSSFASRSGSVRTQTPVVVRAMRAAQMHGSESERAFLLRPLSRSTSSVVASSLPHPVRRPVEAYDADQRRGYRGRAWGVFRMRPVAAMGSAARVAARVGAGFGGRAGPCRGRRGRASPARRASPRRPRPE